MLATYCVCAEVPVASADRGSPWAARHRSTATWVAPENPPVTKCITLKGGPTACVRSPRSEVSSFTGRVSNATHRARQPVCGAINGLPGRLPCLEAVLRTAIRALGLARMGDVQVHARMGAPQLHAGLGVGGRKNAALFVQPLASNSTTAWDMVQTLESQWAYAGLRPLTMSKNALLIFSVIGAPLIPHQSRCGPAHGWA